MHALSVFVLCICACKGSLSGNHTGAGAASGGGGSNAATSTGGASNSTSGSSGGSATSSGGTTSGTSSGPLNLCAGLVADKDAHPMTTIAQPPLGGTIIDAEFGTTVRRITNAGSQHFTVPMYSTISAWNADESLMILYDEDGHLLYDGKSYAFIRVLDIDPADVEQVYWDTSDPDLLYYTDENSFIRYHVGSNSKDTLHDFSDICTGSSVTNGDDPMFTSWDSHRLALGCADGSKMFVYDWSTDTVFGPATPSGSATPPAQVAPSGTLLYLEDGSGQVFDTSTFTLQRSLGLLSNDEHASLGRLANGHDTWNGAIYDAFDDNGDGDEDGPTSDVGVLATFDLTDGSGGGIIGLKTGYPYPPDAHISALAYKQPGWIFVSTIWTSVADVEGPHTPAGLLDMEILIADTNTNTVCRAGRHRSWGEFNTSITGFDNYWAEPHLVPSPSGTRVLFGSDWGNGDSVDSYILELPSYTP